MPSVRDDDRGGEEGGDTLTEPPWHERTSMLVGASIAALLALAILYFLISTVVRQFNEPAQTPQFYVDPGDGSTSFSRSAKTTTTTETITSTVPPVTTEINPGDTSTPSSTDTSPNTNLPSTHRNTPSSGDLPTTRSRPRFNQTRTLYPLPG